MEPNFEFPKNKEPFDNRTPDEREKDRLQKLKESIDLARIGKPDMGVEALFAESATATRLGKIEMSTTEDFNRVLAVLKSCAIIQGVLQASDKPDDKGAVPDTTENVTRLKAKIEPICHRGESSHTGTEVSDFYTQTVEMVKNREQFTASEREIIERHEKIINKNISYLERSQPNRYSEKESNLLRWATGPGKDDLLPMSKHARSTPCLNNGQNPHDTYVEESISDWKPNAPSIYSPSKKKTFGFDPFNPPGGGSPGDPGDPSNLRIFGGGDPDPGGGGPGGGLLPPLVVPGEKPLPLPPKPIGIGLGGPPVRTPPDRPVEWVK